VPLSYCRNHSVVVGNQADKGQDTNLPPIGTKGAGKPLTLRASVLQKTHYDWVMKLLQEAITIGYVVRERHMQRFFCNK